MTRYAAEHIIINGQENIKPWKNRYFIEEPEVISKLDEQRQIIDEHVEENRGLRSDVLLMQKEGAEQRALIEQEAKEIERLKDLNEHLKIEAQGKAKEISGLKAELENYRSIAEKAGATIAVSQLEQSRQEINILKLKLKEIR